MKTAGYKVRRASDRQYEATIVGHPRFHVVFMRPTDIVIQVQEGRCHLGVTGMDVFAEHAVETERPGGGDSRPGLWRLPAGRRRARELDRRQPHHGPGRSDDRVQGRGPTFRVSTRYPALVRKYFRKFGIYYYQLIDSEGAPELHPSLGIADIIVDLTSSGTTLKDNRLREIEGGTVLESASCLIGHAPSLGRSWPKGENGPLAHLLDAIDGVGGRKGWLHLEVVGSQTARGRTSAGGGKPSSGPGASHRARRGLGRAGPARAGGSQAWSATKRLIGVPPVSSSAWCQPYRRFARAVRLRQGRPVDIRRAQGAAGAREGREVGEGTGSSRRL